MHLIFNCYRSSSLSSFSSSSCNLMFYFSRRSFLLLYVQINVIKLWFKAYDSIFYRQKVHFFNFSCSPFLIWPFGGCSKRQSLHWLCPQGKSMIGCLSGGTISSRQILQTLDSISLLIYLFICFVVCFDVLSKGLLIFSIRLTA